MTRLTRTCLFGPATRPDSRSDAELVGAFTAGEDPEAFAALVHRHGPVVLATCRRVLGAAADAEDAFQAVFLALARDARSVRTPGALPAWLHRVALRIARRAAARRRPAGSLPSEVTDPADPFAGMVWRDLRRVLDEELDRLPERYRSPLVLCLLDGCTRDEAAARLGCSLNTVKRRLDVGREVLRARLLRRGVSPVLFAAAVLDPAGLRAVVPPSLTATVSRLAACAEVLPDRVAVLLPRPSRSVGVLPLVLVAAVATTAVVFLPPGPPSVAPPPRPVAATNDTPPTDRLPAGATARFGDARYRHPGPIHSSALSPGETRLATLSTRVLQVLDVDSGHPVFRTRLTDPVEFAMPDLTFSPDGKYLASTLNDKLTLVWDAATGRVALRLPRNEAADRLCRFTPAGLLILTTDRWSLQKPGRTIAVEIPSGQEVASIPVGGIAVLSPDGRRFVKPDAAGPAGADCVLVGDVKTGRALRRLPANAAHGGIRDGLAFSPDGKWLAVVHGGKEVQVWETDSGTKLASVSLPEQVTFGDDAHYKIGFCGDGKMIPPTLWVAGRGDFYRWDLSHGEPTELGLLNPYWGSHVTGAHALKGGRSVLLTGTDGLVHRWDRVNDRESERLLAAHHAPPQIAPTPDGKLLLVGDRTRRVEVWDAATGKVLRTLTRPEPGELGSALASLAVSPDGRRVALGLAAGGVRVLRLADGREERAYWRGGEESQNWMRSAAFSPDGRRLFVSGRKAVWAHDAATGQVAWTVPGASAVDALLPNGRLLVGFHGTTRLTTLDPATGKTLAEFPVLPGGAHPFDKFLHASVLATSPDGQLFALADRSGVNVCRTRDGGMRWAITIPEPGPVAWGFQGGTHGVQALAFSPDGRWLAGGRHDGGVSVWEVATGKELRRLAGHDEPVRAVVFAAGGQALFSAGEDGFAYRWALAPDPARVAGLPPVDLWAATTGDDPAKAFDAATALVATGVGRRFLRDRLPPAKLDATAGQVGGWVADLASPDFATREAASRELGSRVRLLERPIRKAAETTHDPEVRARLVRILLPLDGGLTRDELGATRLVHAAELAGTTEAEVLLEGWAGGATGAVLTAEAAVALGRIKKLEPR